MVLKEILSASALVALLSGTPALAQDKTEFCIPNGNYTLKVESVAEKDQTMAYKLTGPLGSALTKFAKLKKCGSMELIDLINQLDEKKVNPQDTSFIGKKVVFQFEDGKIAGYTEKKEPVPTEKSGKEQPAWAKYETPLERQLVVKYLNSLSSGGKLEKSGTPDKPCLNHYNNISEKLMLADQEREGNPQKNPYLDLLDEINSQKAFSCVVVEKPSEKTAKMPWEQPVETPSPTKPPPQPKKPKPETDLEKTVAQPSEPFKPSTATPPIKEHKEVIPEPPKPSPKNYTSNKIKGEYTNTIFKDEDGNKIPDHLVVMRGGRYKTIPATREDIAFWKANKSDINLNHKDENQYLSETHISKNFSKYAYQPEDSDVITAKPGPAKVAQAKPKTSGLEKTVQAEPEKENDKLNLVPLVPQKAPEKTTLLPEPVPSPEPKTPLDKLIEKGKRQAIVDYLTDLSGKGKLEKSGTSDTPCRNNYVLVLEILMRTDQLTGKKKEEALDNLLSGVNQIRESACQPLPVEKLEEQEITPCVPDGTYTLKVERAKKMYRRGASFRKAGHLGTTLREFVISEDCPLYDSKNQESIFFKDINYFLHTQGNINFLQDWLKEKDIKKSETLGEEYTIKIKDDKITSISEKSAEPLALVDLVTGKKLETEQPATPKYAKVIINRSAPEEKKVAQVKPEPTPTPEKPSHPTPEGVKDSHYSLPERLAPKPEPAPKPKTQEYLPSLVPIKKDGSKNYPELARLCENTSHQQECKQDFINAQSDLDKLAANSEKNSHQLEQAAHRLKELFKKYHVKPIHKEEQREESTQTESIVPEVNYSNPKTSKLESKLKLSAIAGVLSGEGTETNVITGAEFEYNINGILVRARGGYFHTDVQHQKGTSEITSEKKLLDDGLTYKNTTEETSTVTSASQESSFVGAGVGYQIDLNNIISLNLGLGADLRFRKQETNDNHKKTIQLERDNQPLGSPKTFTQPETSTKTTTNFYPHVNAGVCFHSSNLEACLEGELGTAGKLNYGGIIKIGYSW